MMLTLLSMAWSSELAALVWLIVALIAGCASLQPNAILNCHARRAFSRGPLVRLFHLLLIRFAPSDSHSDMPRC